MTHPFCEPATSSAAGDLPHLSVIVPVHAGGQNLDLCLRHLNRCDPAPDEVIVVLDGGRDDDRRIAEAHGAVVVEQRPRRGPAAARNLGAGHAHGRVLFFVDADVALHPDAIGRVLARFKSPGEVAAVFGSYDDQPTARNFLSQYRNLLHHYVHQHSQPVSASFWAACGAIQREVFLDLGGFDERYTRPSIEDIELGDRLHGAELSVLLDPVLLCTHLKRWTVRSLLHTDLFDRAVPWTRLMLERGWAAEDLALARRQKLALITTCLGTLGLVLTPLAPGLAGTGPLFLGCNLWVQRDLLRFFSRQRGAAFAVACVPWLWLYDLYSALGLGLGFGLHVVQRGSHRPLEQRT
ncbi:MAG: glycosyltransferase family 2 protein [Pseudomonadota bacterium]